MATTYIVTPEIAEILRNTRASQRKSQSQVARALNASQTTIQKLEIGQAKESSFLKDLWKYYGLSMDRFEELQRQSESKADLYVATPTTAVAVETKAQWAFVSDEPKVEMTNEMLGAVVRNITLEQLIRVVDGRVMTARRGSQPAQMALHLTRANGTEIRVVMTRALAHDIASQILRNGE